MECSQFSYNLLPNQRDADVAVVVIPQKRQSLSNDVLAIPDSGAIVTPIDPFDAPICSYTRVQAQLPSAKDHVIRGSRRRYAGRVKTRAKMYGFCARRMIREGRYAQIATKFAIVVVDGDDRSDVREATIVAVARARLYWRWREERVRSRDAARRRQRRIAISKVRVDKNVTRDARRM